MVNLTGDEIQKALDKITYAHLNNDGFISVDLAHHLN
jgi:hypothetical protein